jgi:folate-binding protein YgfZ
MSVSDGVRALEAGRAFVDLSEWRCSGATGRDAIPWLNDLLTRSLDDIGPNELRRSLFLDRTGRIRADVHVGVTTGPDGSRGAMLFQDFVQPLAIIDLLDPYVLSADVALDDWSGQFALIVVRSSVAEVQHMEWPGPLDRMGHTIVRPDELEATLEAIRSTESLTEATAQDAETWRIRRGVPRFGVDFDETWLPSEAGLDDLVDGTKGCFLGQESVARVRNLGHPPRLVLPFRAEGRVYPMAPIMAGGEQVGRVTSVAPLDDEAGTACIGHVRWDARAAELGTDGGARIAVRSDHAA